MMDFLNKIRDTINKYSMLSSEGQTVLIGLSGGPDSVCLAMVLNKLASKFGLSLHAVYVDHGLRPGETGGEIDFLKTFTGSINMPLYIKTADVKAYAKEQGMSRQEAGRTLRYRIFHEVGYEIKAQKIAVGHNLDDQAETFFLRILRGSGPKGVSGIPPVRGNIIRPLIEVQRKEIEKFLDEEKVSYVVDSSNLKTDYLRNKLRLSSLMPLLREINPAIMETISRTLDIFREEDRYFDILVTKTLMKLITKKTDKSIELFLSPLEFMDKVILRRVLRRAIDETKGLREIGFIHIEDIISLIKKGRAGDRLYLPSGIRVIKQYSTLLLTSEPPKRLGEYTLIPDGQTILKEAGVLIEAHIKEESLEDQGDGGKAIAVFDADKVSFPLSARPRQDGDFFYPAGFGRRKKLQDFFVDEKVPRDERDRVPVIASGGNDIIWVAGYRPDERFKVKEDTVRFLVLRMKQLRS